MIDELTLLLKAKNIFVHSELKNAFIENVKEETHRAGRMGYFSVIIRDQYASNVATICAFATRISAECGIDWGWEFNYDNNTYTVGFNETEKGKRLFDMFWDYKRAHVQARLGSQPLKMDVLKNVW